MNKEDYAQLHYLLSKLRYELEICFCKSNNKKHADKIRGHITAIEDIMKVFIMECD